MTRRPRTSRDKIKRFFKAWGPTLTVAVPILGIVYGAGIWSANIHNAIKENKATQEFNKEIAEQKKAYDEKIRALEIENDNLRHQYQLLELNYKKLENESNKKNK